MPRCSLNKCDNETHTESTECILHCNKEEDTWANSESDYVKEFWKTIRTYMEEASTQNNIGMNHTYQFLKIVFPAFEPMIISKNTINKTANFWNCIDDEPIKVQFDKSVSFFECTFQYGANFRYVSFPNYTNFNSIICEKDFICSNTEFGSNTTFTGFLNSEKKSFKGKVDFSSSIFENEIKFYGIDFDGDVDFDYIEVKGTARFISNIFHNQKTSFLKSRWGDTTIFGDCSFNTVVFDDTKVLKDINIFRFNTCQFNDFKMTNHSTISELTFNKKCIFNKNTTFSLTNINTLKFEDTTIEGKMLIKSENQSNPIIYNNFQIINCVLQSELIFNLTHAIINKLEISNVINLSKSFDFNIIKVKNIFKAHNTDFKNTHFNNMDFSEAYKLDFYNISVHNTEFNNVNWGQISKDRITNDLNENSEVNTTKRNIYTQLKSAHDRLGNKIDANKFYALEMQEAKSEFKESSKLKDKQLHDRKHDYLILTFHQTFSNFSQSAVLPIFWMFLISMGMALISLPYTPTNGVQNFTTMIAIYPLIMSIFIILPIISTWVRNKLIKSSKIKILIASLFFITYWIITIDTVPNQEFLYPLNQMAIQINPFKLFKPDTTGFQMSTLLAKIFFVYLSYQFIIAIKQNTKR